MGGARRFFFFFLPIITARAAHAGLVVNELYYDHPGADGGYEFVELLNTGDASLSLDGVVLEFHNGSGEGWTVLWSAPPGLALAPGALWVLGGDLVLPAPDMVVGISLQNGPDAIRLARRTLRTIQGNLFWAFAYNVAAIPLAVAGLLNPIVAAAAMALSSLFVVSNSLRLRRFHSAREST